MACLAYSSDVQHTGLSGMNSFSRDPENAMTRDGFEIVAQVNYLGHYLLTELLLDSLKAAATPEAPTRIVNMS